MENLLVSFGYGNLAVSLTAERTPFETTQTVSGHGMLGEFSDSSIESSIIDSAEIPKISKLTEHSQAENATSNSYVRAV